MIDSIDEGYKEVNFHEYCEKCKHKDKDETEEPCDECLEEPRNLETRRPVKFEEEKSKKKQKNSKSGSSDT